jgi:hypothetical protein
VSAVRAITSIALQSRQVTETAHICADYMHGAKTHQLHNHQKLTKMRIHKHLCAVIENMVNLN